MRFWPVALLFGLTAVGLALRLTVIGQAAFADELATYWVVATRSVGGVISTVHTDAEITPPLSFVLSELTTQIDLSQEMLRLPSLLAGTATIPLVYLVGARTVGRRAAAVAAALTALAPFMVYYSAEARAYAVMMFFALLSTLALLKAIDGDGRRWWVLYGLCACAAVYSHYTSVFFLAGQFAWVMWAHPEHRRSVFLASAAAAVGFLPWVSGLLADFDSPTTDILSALEPFTFETVRISLAHWSIGFPYSIVRARALPGEPALIMLGLGLLGAVFALARERLRSRDPLRINPGLVLVVVLLVSAPLGEAVASALSTDLFGTRNLAVAWPGFALTLAALVTAPPKRLWIATTGLALASFAIGAVKLLDEDVGRPDYVGAAEFVEREGSPGDVVIDAFVLSPGPLSALDVQLDDGFRVLRLGAPQQNDHPFVAEDPVPSVPDVARKAIAAATGRRLIFVTTPGLKGYSAPVNRIIRMLPPSFEPVAKESYPGLVPLETIAFEDSD